MKKGFVQIIIVGLIVLISLIYITAWAPWITNQFAYQKALKSLNPSCRQLTQNEYAPPIINPYWKKPTLPEQLGLVPPFGKETTLYVICDGKSTKNIYFVSFLGTVKLKESTPILLKSQIQQTKNTTNETANWKTYKSKDNLYQISYPGNWTVNEMDDVSMGDNAIDISIIEWNDGSKEYAEEQWQSTPCGGSGDGNSEIGCIPMEIKESKKINLNGHLVYWRVDGNGQIHAWVPNKDKNKTIEIYSVLLKDKNLFDQILSTFKFTN